MKVVLSLFILVSTFNAYALDEKFCTNVDLRSKLPPVRDQDGAGWCVAFASADLVSYELNQNVSPHDLALNGIQGVFDYIGDTLKQKPMDCSEYTTYRSDCIVANKIIEANKKNAVDWHKRNRDNTYNRAAISPLTLEYTFHKKGGFCLEKDFPSEGFVGDHTPLWKAVVFGGTNTSQGLSTRYSLLQPNRKSIAGKVCTDCKIGPALSMLPHANMKDIQAIVDKEQDITLPFKLRDLACKNRVGKNHRLSLERAEQTPDKIVDLLNRALDKKKPAYLAMDIEFAVSAITKFSSSNENWLHAVTIAGRKWNTSTKQCELLIRNSWGKSCSSYNLKYANKCENGNFWISLNDLKPHVLDGFSISLSDEQWSK